jgi:hypothetical protein
MKRKHYKFVICFGLVCWVGFSDQVHAQVYSQNIVGYINLVLFPGSNLIANQLANADNTLDTIFSHGVPEGTTFTKWDAASVQYLPSSTYDTNSGWSINYELGFGEGGRLQSPSMFTNTLVGTIWSGFNGMDPFVPPLVSNSGSLLLSCYIPISNATFYDVVGRDPQNGESVTILDALSQIATTTTFQNGVWNNGDPSLNAGQSAFFNLEPVPEPASWTLLGSGIFLLVTFRRRQRR